MLEGVASLPILMPLGSLKIEIEKSALRVRLGNTSQQMPRLGNHNGFELRIGLERPIGFNEKNYGLSPVNQSKTTHEASLKILDQAPIHNEKDFFCEHYRKIGHIKDTCWKTHEKYVNWKSR